MNKKFIFALPFLLASLNACHKKKEPQPVVQTSLDSPIIAKSIDDSRLITWSNVLHADAYNIYINDSVDSKTNNTSYYFNKEEQGTYSVKVQAISNDKIYSNSSFSNILTYVITMGGIQEDVNKTPLATPTLSLNENILNWNSVSNAFYYEIYCDEVLEDTVTKTSYQINKKDFGSYSYFVKAIPENENSKYEASSNSNKVIYTYSFNINDCYKLVIDASDKVSGNYKTGNWASYCFSNYEFSLARFYDDDDDEYFTQLVSYPSLCNSYADGGMNSCIANVDYIPGIQRIDITYKTGNGNEKPYISYGANATCLSSKEIPLTASDMTYSVYTGHVNYFKLFGSKDCTTYIQKIEIYYDDVLEPGYNDLGKSGDDLYRFPVTTYSGSKTPGSSFVDIPTKVIYENGNALVQETKRYTYYTINYLKSHASEVQNALMTDPVDICNYVLAFKEAPANFCKYNSKANQKTANSLSTVETVFDTDDILGVSQEYTRTNGYMNSVPYKSSPSYYEYDIKQLSEYSTTNRGVGRVVVLETGFNSAATDYGNDWVCLYTDDHYATFQEYYNNGTFSHRFNGEQELTGYAWSCPSTIN
ncbi:MAG: hypothetical protein HUJ61_04845 [Bacilli bacterium]|nr:hypothetical protein [Bacilli bacterium]